MSDLIQWPRAKYWDKPWNPIIGCKPCSPACEHCYAVAWAKRFSRSFKPHRALSQPKPPRSGIVFVGNMTDLFGEWADPLDYMRQTCVTKTTTYLYLTKRVWHMTNCMSFIDDDYSPVRWTNHYFGFTAENQEWYDRRIDVWVRNGPYWANGWLSCEPLLGPINLSLPSLWKIPKWIVVGCESGPNRRPCKIEWVGSIVEQCRTANVPVFVKQIDIDGKCERDITKFPKHLQIRQVPWAKEGETK